MSMYDPDNCWQKDFHTPKIYHQFLESFNIDLLTIFHLLCDCCEMVIFRVFVSEKKLAIHCHSLK